MTELAPIVVGIDGGDASVAALELAVREAGLRHSAVVAITCWPATDRRDGAGPLLCSTYDQAVELLEHVISQVQRRHPRSVPIIREVEQNIAGPALVSASRSAELVVLGSTTRGPFGHRHGRQTIEHCLLYAESPVVVVPWTAARLDELDIALDLHQTPAPS
jgi:nucleotide-binding universal stress UspA family protein